jgi:hypothetical protein
MKKTKTKTVKGAKKTGGIKATRKPVDLAAVREGISNLVGAQALSMVETTIGEVDKGHYVAMKYLFELIGLYPGGAEQESSGESVLAKTLLRRLNLPEESNVEASVTKDTATASEKITADAVE